jgi:hypothetical protein
MLNIESTTIGLTELSITHELLNYGIFNMIAKPFLVAAE